MALSALTIDSPQYATDADLFAAIPGDFFRLVPDANKLAFGTDGQIDPGSPWVLRSATVDFSTRAGVTPGRMLVLSPPASATSASAPLRQRFESGEAAEVESVVAGLAPTGGLVLTRPRGVPDGEPYGGATTLTGIAFKVATFDPQLQDATSKVRSKLRSLVAVADLTADLDDEDLTDLCIYRMLRDMYRLRSIATSSSGTGPDEWGGRAVWAKESYDEKMTEVAVELGILPSTSGVGGSGSGSGGSGGTGDLATTPLAAGSYRIVPPVRSEWG